MTLGTRSIAALALAAACTPTGVASAAQTSSGGMEYTAAPVISRVKCATQCAGKTRIQAGGTLAVSGKRLRSVRTVVFHGSEATKRDNVSVRVRPRSDRSLRVRVPLDAGSGPVSVWKTAE